MSTARRDNPSLHLIRYCDATIEASPGRRLLDVVLTANPDHRHICGGNGFCTSCRVEVLGDDSGLSPVSRLERERLGRDAGRLRLACQTFVRGDAVVRIPLPRRSLFPPDGD